MRLYQRPGKCLRDGIEINHAAVDHRMGRQRLHGVAADAVAVALNLEFHKLDAGVIDVETQDGIGFSPEKSLYHKTPQNFPCLTD